MCSVLRCREVTDQRELRACLSQRCGAFQTAEPESPGTATGHEQRSADEYENCVQQKCGGARHGYELRVCAVSHCWLGAKAKGKERSSLHPHHRPLSSTVRRRLAMQLAKRRGVKGLWPDEFETRVAERALWPDEYETRNAERRRAEAAEEEDGQEQEEEQEKALVRRARSEAVANPEPAGAPAKSELKSVKKRWSTRLCMESHCKNARGKVQYFMCGKAFCHR